MVRKMNQAKCKYCSKPIVFLYTEKNKRMPVDIINIGNYETLYDKEKHTSHFITCENYRGKGKK